MNTNIFEDKRKNKKCYYSYIHLNNWLDRLLCKRLMPIQSHLHHHENNYLERIAEEYRNLITISEPSVAQQRQIEQILELAVDDTNLSNLLDYVEEDVAREIGLADEKKISNHNSAEKTMPPDCKDNDYLQNDGNIVYFPLTQVDCQIPKTQFGKTKYQYIIIKLVAPK